jgi:hypothetical protein
MGFKDSENELTEPSQKSENLKIQAEVADCWRVLYVCIRSLSLSKYESVARLTRNLQMRWDNTYKDSVRSFTERRKK